MPSDFSQPCAGRNQLRETDPRATLDKAWQVNDVLATEWHTTVSTIRSHSDSGTEEDHQTTSLDQDRTSPTMLWRVRETGHVTEQVVT